MPHETVFPTEPMEAGKGGEGGDLQIANTDFVTAVFPLLPEGAFAAMCSNSGDPSLGGWVETSTGNHQGGTIDLVDTALVGKFEQPVEVSCVTSDKVQLAKTMKVDPATGDIVKEPAGLMTSGTIETVKITSPEGFSRFLRSREKNQALVHGICGHKKALVVTKSKLDSLKANRPADAMPVIARSKEHLFYSDGPGVIMFDHDKPRDNSIAISGAALDQYKPDDLLNILATIHPAITIAASVSSPSTSACIFDHEGKELRGEGAGSHTYLFVENATDIPRFLAVIGKRLVMNGYGRIEISRSGTLLYRTLIDLVVGSPERVDYVAGALCKDGLEQRLPAPTIRNGTLLDTSTLADLSPEEESHYAKIIDELKAQARPSQEQIREEYLTLEAGKLSAENKISLDDARQVVLSRQDHVLADADLLYFAHMKGNAVSVADVFNDPVGFNGKSLADPLEPDYDGGSLTKAKFYWNAGNRPMVRSYAHGMTEYRFERNAPTDSCFEEDIANLLERVKTDCGAPFEPEVIKMLAWLKGNDKSRFMQVRDSIKRANSAVIISEVDRDIRLYRKRNSFQSSQSSSYSLSGTYPSCKSSLKNKNLHFQDVLVTQDENGNDDLVVESKAAFLIAEELRGRFAYDVSGMRWYRYSGCQWVPCIQTELDTAVTELLYAGAGALGFKNSYQSGVASLLLKGGHNQLAVKRDGMIPFQNGLFDSGQKTLQPINPENAFTWVLPFDYTASAECPNFLEWLHVAVDGDTETVKLLQAWMNTLLTGRPDLQVFLHLIGPAGTGKSTFGRLVFILVGNDNATTTTLKQLETNRFEAAGIYGKRLVAIEDADKYGGSVSVLKAMTGQDPLRLERKNQQQQGAFIFNGQTLMMSNERLATTDYTSGIERRRITVEFKRRITDEEKKEWRDRGGEEVILYGEAPGIINWALSLSREEVTSIFKGMPERISQANFKAARHNNPILDWMTESLIPDHAAQTKIGNKKKIKGFNGEDVFEGYDLCLYPNYLTWCLASGREAVSLQRFSATLIDAAHTIGIEAKKLPRASDGVKIQGLRIRGEQEPLFDYEKFQKPMNTGLNGNMPIMKEMNTVNTLNHIPKPKMPMPLFSMEDANAEFF